MPYFFNFFNAAVCEIPSAAPSFREERCTRIAWSSASLSVSATASPNRGNPASEIGAAITAALPCTKT